MDQAGGNQPGNNRQGRVQMAALPGIDGGAEDISSQNNGHKKGEMEAEKPIDFGFWILDFGLGDWCYALEIGNL